MTPPWGPALTMLVLTLEEKDRATVLKVSDSAIGKIADKCEKEAGWKELFEGAFKPYAEKA